LVEQTEYEFIPALVHGASPALLTAESEGGLGVSLGSGAGGGAGIPLMNKWFYTTDTGLVTPSGTPATHNSTVNSAVNGIDASTDDMVTIAQIDIIRSHLDEIKFEPITVAGKTYKAAVPCDPDLMYRIKSALGDMYKYAGVRGQDNPYFHLNMVEYNDMLFFAWTNLKKYRPTYNAVTGYPDFGVLAAGTDPRTYKPTGRVNALMMFIGARAVLEGYNGAVSIKEDVGRFEKSMAYSAHTYYGYMRGEWYSKDGRAASEDSTENRSLLVAAFYEPGVGHTS
jgi:hypothetical protein